MASSTMDCQRLSAATTQRLCIGHEPGSLDYTEAFHSPLLQRCRLGLLGQPAQLSSVRWLEKRRGNSTVRASSSPMKMQDPSMSAVAAISLPFGKQGLAAVSAEPQTQTHIVQRGQVMSKIAQLYNTDLKTLHELNPGVALDYVRPKQTIIVPIVKEAAGGGSGSAPMYPPTGSTPALRPQAQASRFSPPSPPSKAPPTKPKAETLAAPETVAPIPEQHIMEASRGPLQYTVQPGDSLFTIAEKFGVSMTELVKLNKLHFKSTIRPTQVLKVPANSKPQAAVVASVCPAPAPTCPPSYKKPQNNWTMGVGVALLLAAGAVYAAKLFQGGKKSPLAEGKLQPPPVIPPQAAGDIAATPNAARGFQGAEVTPAPATPSLTEAVLPETQPEVAASSVVQPAAAASSVSAKVPEAEAAALTQQDAVPVSPPSSETSVTPEVDSQGAMKESSSQPTTNLADMSSEERSAPNPPPQTTAPTEAVTASISPAQTPAQSELTPSLTPIKEAPLPAAESATVVANPEVVSDEPKKADALVAGQAPQPAPAAERVEKPPPAAAVPVAASGSLWVEASELPSLEATAQQKSPAAAMPASDVVPVTSEMMVAPSAETTALMRVEGEGSQNGAASAAALESAANGSDGASKGRAVPDDIMPDEVLLREPVSSQRIQPETNKTNVGVGSSFCMESTITRALQNAYQGASQALGPLHQTLAFVALSSGRIGLASEDYTWGSTAEAVIVLRTTLPADCNLQGICTWGVPEQANKGGGEEKEWAAVMLFSGRNSVLTSGSTITTGSARLAAEMAAEGLAAKAVGKKLKAVIIVTSPQVDQAAIDVVRETIRGLPVYAISEGRGSNRPASFAKEWQVSPPGAISAVAPGISLLGVTTDADFGGAFLASVVGQWLYGPKCEIDVMPAVVSKEMATSGR